MRLVSLVDGTPDDVLIVRTSEFGRRLQYWCEGCGCPHDIAVRPYRGANASWEWNGDARLPVISPSQLARTYEYPSPYEPESNPEHAEIRRRFELAEAGLGPDAHEWMMNHPKWGRRCHTFIGTQGARPGEITFLSDCTHVLRGPRPLLARRDWPSRSFARLEEVE